MKLVVAEREALLANEEEVDMYQKKIEPSRRTDLGSNIIELNKN